MRNDKWITEQPVEFRPKASDDEPGWLLSTRWCVYIDILGFSKFWEDEQSKAFDSLRVLMCAIHRIGTKVYPDDPGRLFVHQMGDGFAIVSDFGETSLERPIAIAVALMRCVATSGTFAVAAIAEGKFSDITGCYPQEVMGSYDDGVVSLGDGLMTLSPVMGTAFIRAYRLCQSAPPGPFLIVPRCHRDRVPAYLFVREIQSPKNNQLLSINWIRAESELLLGIQQNADISTSSSDSLVQTIQDYCSRYTTIREKWKGYLGSLLDIRV